MLESLKHNRERLLDRIGEDNDRLRVIPQWEERKAAIVSRHLAGLYRSLDTCERTIRALQNG